MLSEFRLSNKASSIAVELGFPDNRSNIRLPGASSYGGLKSRYKQIKQLRNKPVNDLILVLGVRGYGISN